MPEAAPGRRGRRRWYSAKDRPRATTRRRTRRARGSFWRQFERVRAALVEQQPPLGLQQIPRGRMGESAKPVCRDHAMAGNDDRQPVVAAGLADRPWLGAEALGQLAVGQGLAARNGAQRIPEPPLEVRAFDEQRQLEARVRILAIALEL